MLRLAISLLAVLAGAVAVAEVVPQAPAADPQAVAEVKAGKRAEANAAWWGFDAADATAALQGAIDSGAKRVVVPNVGKPWLVRPIALRGDQEVVFEKGVEVVAKPGAFPGLRDFLFSATNVENVSLVGPGATLRMQKAEYTEGEWRHALAILSCRNVKVVGLTLKESGGDGIYLGRGPKGSPAANEKIVIKDVTCDGNRRQGISIITAKDLVIEDCALINTSGTAPQAGIDFEPNAKDEKLVNCIVRRCRIENNRGPGFTLNVNQMDKTTEDLSVRVEDCRISASGREGIGVHRISDNGPGGFIEFVGCTVRYGPSLGGLTVGGKSPERAHLRFSRCTWQLAADTPPLEKPRAERPAFVFSAAIKKDAQRTGGIEFVDCTVEDPRSMPFLKGSAPKDLADPWKDIRGNIRVTGPGAAADLGGAKIELKIEPASPAK
ncbi:MAG: right-handed parallel beta-helix repeat-containing protein [Planctomycetota bacterium]|nr:right-handed parallel beta-helix repeat-containing protein [Planctomycetota bacterium]